MVGAFRQWSDGLRLNIALPSPSDARIRAGASLLGGGGGGGQLLLSYGPFRKEGTWPS